MNSDIFQVQQPRKDAILVFEGGPKASLSYAYNHLFDVYVCTKLSIFESYLERLLHNRGKEKIYVILLFSGFQELIEIIAVLEKTSTPESSKYYNDAYRRDYQYYLRQIQDEPSQDTAVSFLPLAKGQADRSLSFDVTFLINADLIKNIDSFSSINIQQKVRFIALKHGAATISVSIPEGYFENADNVGQLVEHLDYEKTVTDTSKTIGSHDKHPRPLPIFDANGIELLPDFQVHMLFPKGWDSWSKIQLLGTSLHASSPGKLLASQKDMVELNSLYDAALTSTGENSVSSVELLLQHLEPSTTNAIISSAEPPVDEPLTMQQLLIETHNASKMAG